MRDVVLTKRAGLECGQDLAPLTMARAAAPDTAAADMVKWEREQYESKDVVACDTDDEDCL